MKSDAVRALLGSRDAKAMGYRILVSNVGSTGINLVLIGGLLQTRLLAWLGCMFGAGRYFFAVLFLFLLHLFVVRDIAGVSH